MPQLIDRIIEILGRHEERLTTEAIVRLLREEPAWDFGSADPPRAVANALLDETHTTTPRITRFLDRYTLRQAPRRIRVGAAPEPVVEATPAPPPSPTAELTGEGPRLLLDLLQGPRLAEHLDGRTVAALTRSRCVVERGGWVQATKGGRAAVLRQLQSQARASKGRGSLVFAALADLVDAIPAGSEIPVGGVPCAAADVLLALYDAALATERRPQADGARAQSASRG
ncbi:MAG TPA: hypothetical protein VE913_09590 [Longimicrobium sp.]|nr:hypothetical protein [Longimicrobium sp.]